MEAFVIGIAGGSGSGKSTFAKRLKDRFLLCAGDNYKAGQEGGEAEHVLTAKQFSRETCFFV